jgi:hypothetical protein
MKTNAFPQVYQTLRKKNISAPFNFQHVTHTQQEQLPQLASVTDSELVSEFWAASAFQAPRSELRGIKADPVDSSYRVGTNERRPSTASSIRSESFAPRHRGLSFTTSVHELDSTPCTPNEVESPIDERARSLSLSSRSHSFSRGKDWPLLALSKESLLPCFIQLYVHKPHPLQWSVRQVNLRSSNFLPQVSNQCLRRWKVVDPVQPRPLEQRLCWICHLLHRLRCLHDRHHPSVQLLAKRTV